MSAVLRTSGIFPLYLSLKFKFVSNFNESIETGNILMFISTFYTAHNTKCVLPLP